MKGIRLDLSPKVTHKRMTLTIKRFFSPIQRRTLRIVMPLVVDYDLELHQMDVKTVFLNGELKKEVYMDQPKGFVTTRKEIFLCKLKKSIYGLKQASI